MDKLYSVVTSTDLWQNGDPFQYLYNYFITEGAFTNAFLIALAIAAAGLILFYGVLCTMVPKLANLTTWVVTFVIVGLLTFGITQIAIIGSETSQTGFFSSCVQKSNDDRVTIPNDQIQEFDQAVQSLQDKMDQAGNEVALRLDLFNMLYALIIFFVISIVVKGATPYGKNIPF